MNNFCKILVPQVPPSKVIICNVQLSRWPYTYRFSSVCTKVEGDFDAPINMSTWFEWALVKNCSLITSTWRFLVNKLADRKLCNLVMEVTPIAMQCNEDTHIVLCFFNMTIFLNHLIQKNYYLAEMRFNDFFQGS